MCKIGDIIVVESYQSHGSTMEHHSFIVLDDDNGIIRGLNYDMIAVVMSSFHNRRHKESKMRYPGNFPIAPDDQDIIGGNNGKFGYVKSEQFYYFKKDKIKYRVIGYIEENIFNLLIEFIEELSIPIQPIVENL